MLVYVDHLRVPVIRQWCASGAFVGMLMLPAARVSNFAIPVSPMVLLCHNVANVEPLAVGHVAVGSRWWGCCVFASLQVFACSQRAC